MNSGFHYIEEGAVFVKNPEDCKEFTAVDGCHIRELLHPGNDAVELPYSIALARVEPGRQTYRHRLDRAEVYYLLAGSGRMHIDEQARAVTQGEAVYIPAGAVQWLENTGVEELRFLAIVNPPWSKEGDERLE
jgi:mannose-6-phosphate isomerase-like protein (cupin superfamily)